MIPFRKSIGFRLLGISFILLALPLLVDSFILARTRYEHTISDAKAYMVEIANFREVPLSQMHPLDLPMMELLVHYLGLESNFPTATTPELNEKLKQIAQVGEFYGAFLLKITPDNEYIVIASGLTQYIGHDYTNFFKLNYLYNPQALERGFSSYIAFDDKTLRPYFIMAHAIYSLKEKRYVGLLAISDDIALKVTDLLAPEKHDYEINFALMLPSTIVFASSDPDLKFQYFIPLKPDFLALFQKQEGPAFQHLPKEPLAVKNDLGPPFFEFTWKGKEQIGYVRTVSGGNYALLTYAAKDKVFQAPLANFWNIFGTYGAILLIGGGLATLLTMRMATPIQNLSLVMQKIQEGRLHMRYQNDPFGFEINHLGAIFNETVDAVLEQKHVVEEERVKRETLARELNLGKQVQRSLLPQDMPSYPGVDLAEIYIPAIEVGGDFYDVFVVDKPGGQKLALAVADASGKGVQACFYSLSVRNMLRAYVGACDDISMAMGATNDLFGIDTGETGMFVTVLAAVYDEKTKRLSYYSCGHNPGYVKKEDGSIEKLANDGMAMGVFPSKVSQERTTQLQVGDVVVFYTDGITEAMDEDDNLFGDDRLIHCIQAVRTQTAREIAHEIVKAVADFVKGAPQHDDITLLVMKIIK